MTHHDVTWAHTVQPPMLVCDEHGEPTGWLPAPTVSAWTEPWAASSQREGQDG